MKPKVLFLTSSYPRGTEDTATVFLRYLAEHLTESGVEVHVLAPADGTGRTMIEGKVTVHRFRYFAPGLEGLAYGSGILPNLKRSPWLWLQVPFFVAAMTYWLFRLHATQGFDLLHAHWILPQGLVGLMGSFFFRVPLVVSAHGTDAFAFRSRFADGLKRFVLKRSVAWTANTASTAGAVVSDSCLPRARIIPMGVDVSLFSNGNPAALRRELLESDYLALFVGRLIENKGCPDLVQALSLLSEKTRARTTLWVVGDGDQRERLELTAKTAGIGERVRFFGAVNHRRLPDFYAAADLVVIPSRLGTSGESEGQSLVVLEAFAARACVVATSIGGITSMVRHQITGMLVAAGDARALSTTIEQILNEPDLRRQLAENAFTEVCERYSWHRIAGEFADLYQDFLRKGGHS